MNPTNRKEIKELVLKEGEGKILNYDNEIFWREDLVRKALNLIEVK